MVANSLEHIPSVDNLSARELTVVAGTMVQAATALAIHPAPDGLEGQELTGRELKILRLGFQCCQSVLLTCVMPVVYEAIRTDGRTTPELERPNDN